MSILKFRSLFLLLFFQCYLGYAIKGEADNDYTTIRNIGKLHTDISNASATEETDLTNQKSSDPQSNDNEPMKSNKISGHETDEPNTHLTADISNKTPDQLNNHNLINLILFPKIGVKGGKSLGSKVGGSKGGGTKTGMGGGLGFYLIPINTSSSGGEVNATAWWIALGVLVGVCGIGFLVGYLIFKYAGSCATE